MNAEHFQSVSGRVVHEVLWDVLRARFKGALAGTHTTRVEVVASVVAVLGKQVGMRDEEAAGVASQMEEMYRAFSTDTRPNWKSGDHPDVAAVEAAIWRLVQRGVIYPRLGKPWEGNNIPWTIDWLVLTPVGSRALVGAGIHPAHDDFVTRATKGCIGLPSEVIGRLEDAHDCFNGGLHRAAVVMLRLSYEATITSIYNDHNIEQHVPPKLRPGKFPKAKKLLDGLVHVVDGLKTKPEGTANLALHIADVIRQDGNTAAHDWARDYADATEVEELMILAGRNVRRLWALKAVLP